MTTTAPQLTRLVKQARTALESNRGRAQRLLARLERLSAAPARRFHEMGQVLATLKAPALYRALGHKSFAALLRRHGLGSPTRASKLIRIAEELPAARASALGLEAAYIEASGRTNRRGERATRAAAPSRELGSNAARAALARLERRLSARLRDGERAAWDVGILFDQIARASHHRAAGYDSLEAYADARFAEQGYRTLSRYRRVALAFTRATTIRHGTHKLELALRYIDATPAPERPAEIPRLRIAVPGVGPVPFAKVTARQLESAVQALTHPATVAPRLPRGAAPVVRALEGRLKSGRPWSHAPRLSTRVTKDERGRLTTLLSIHDVPIDALARLARSLRPDSAVRP